MKSSGIPEDRQGISWQTGFRKRTPWWSVLGLVGFAGCCGALKGVLDLSNGKEVDNWPRPGTRIPVSVVLALITNIVHICLGVALSQAYTVAWWLKALKGAPLGVLQFDLRIQSSFSPILGRTRSVDSFTIAAVLALVLNLITSPLIQRASVTTIQHLGPRQTTITTFISQESLPANFSFYQATNYSGHNAGNGIFTPLFGEVSRGYSNRDIITVPLDGHSCAQNSICEVKIPATGFDVSCNDTPVPFLTSYDASQSHHLFTIEIDFGVDAAWQTVQTARLGQINTTVLFKPDAACEGNLTQRKCVLRLATIAYPLTLSNGSATLEPWKFGENETISMTTIQSPDMLSGSTVTQGYETMLGGIASVAKDIYSGDASIVRSVLTASQQDAKYFYYWASTGHSVSNYISSDTLSYGLCIMTFEDATADIVNTIRELMFRSVVVYSIANKTAVIPQILTADETRIVSVYESQYEFLWFTLGSLSLEVIIIVFLLLGWHRLGRDVSSDGIEIAKAFGAPLLQKGSSNDNIDGLLRRVGHQRVRYGEAIDGNGTSTEADEQVLPLTLDQSSTGDVLLDNMLQREESGSGAISRYELSDSEHAGDWLEGGNSMVQTAARLEFGVAARVRNIRKGILY